MPDIQDAGVESPGYGQVSTVIQKHKPIRMKKIRDSARGQDCTVQSPFCNGDTETVVFAHYGEAGEKGVGLKAGDEAGFYACYDCHTLIDQHKMSKIDELWYCFRACRRTWRSMLDSEILK